MHRSPFSLPFSLRSFRRGCLGGCFCFAGVHPRIRSAPSGPSLSLVRCPPRFAQGTNHRLFLGLGLRSRTTVVLERELERGSGRRLAPYPSAASDGGQKMRRSTAKAPPNSQMNPTTSQRQTHFRGAERMRGWTLAKQKPPLIQPLGDATRTRTQSSLRKPKASIRLSARFN